MSLNTNTMKIKFLHIEGVRRPKFSMQQAAAGSRGSGGRINQEYSAVEVVPEVAQQGLLVTRLKATLSNQSMKQHGAVVPSSRLAARAVQGYLLFYLNCTHCTQLSLSNSC